MDRDDVCILVNSTPAYFYMLPLHFAMLRRYAPSCKWKFYLATEVPDDPVCLQVAKEYHVAILGIPKEKSGFLESRMVALHYLQDFYNYVLPLQEDFLLEHAMDGEAIASVLKFMDEDPTIVSARLMPCPGPSSDDVTLSHLPQWKLLDEHFDNFGFCFQATLWRTNACHDWFKVICTYLEETAPKLTTDPKQRKFIEITANIAENADGQRKFWAWSREQENKHIAWTRRGPWPNAVYLSPFPYRPTAIVKGKLEQWAKDLAKREGFSLGS